MAKKAATVLPTQRHLIIPFVLARLRNITKLPAEACFMPQVEPMAMPYDGMGDRYLWLRWEELHPMVEIYVGGGRRDARTYQAFAVTARTRLETDLPGRDQAWLLDPTRGHDPFLHQIENALHGLLPWPTMMGITTPPTGSSRPAAGGRGRTAARPSGRVDADVLVSVHTRAFNGLPVTGNQAGVRGGSR